MVSICPQGWTIQDWTWNYWYFLILKKGFYLPIYHCALEVLEGFFHHRASKISFLLEYALFINIDYFRCLILVESLTSCEFLDMQIIQKIYLFLVYLCTLFPFGFISEQQMAVSCKKVPFYKVVIITLRTKEKSCTIMMLREWKLKAKF